MKKIILILTILSGCKNIVAHVPQHHFSTVYIVGNNRNFAACWKNGIIEKPGLIAETFAFPFPAFTSTSPHLPIDYLLVSAIAAGDNGALCSSGDLESQESSSSFICYRDEQHLYTPEFLHNYDTLLTTGVAMGGFKNKGPGTPDIYTSCTKFYSTAPLTPYLHNALYFKNTTRITLGDNIHESNTTGITISGNDVYVVGNIRIGDNNSPFNAVYWKNGQVVNLSEGYAKAIVVIGNDVYVAGTKKNANAQTTAVFWKNGVATVLEDNNDGVYTSAIAVSGGDIYVAGGNSNNGYNVAKYWKNGQVVNIGSFITTGITVTGSEVDVCGWDISPSSHHSVGKWYSNGTLLDLDDGYGSVDAKANAICVVP